MSHFHASRRQLLAGMTAGAAITLTSCGSEGLGAGSDKNVSIYASSAFTNADLVASIHAATGLGIVAATTAADADVVVVMASDLGKIGLSRNYAAIDLRLIRNVNNIDQRSLHGRYPESPQYALPFAWDVTGIGFRRAKVNAVPYSWNVLYTSPLYRGRTALRFEPADLIGIGAKMLGQSAQNVSDSTAMRVGQIVAEQRRSAKLQLISDDARDLETGDLDIVMVNNATAAEQFERDCEIGFAVPIEGGLIDTQMLLIRSTAKSIQNAHALINCLLDPTRAAAVCQISKMTPTIEAAANLLAAARVGREQFYPGLGLLNTSEYRLPVSPMQEAIIRNGHAIAIA